MVPEYTSEMADYDAELSLMTPLAHEAMSFAGKLWANYAKMLISSGARPQLAMSVCFDAYEMEYNALKSEAMWNDFSGFEYPGSRRVLSKKDAAQLAMESLCAGRRHETASSLKLSRAVFRGYLEKALGEDLANQFD